MMSKIKPHHLQKTAYVYLRQSSMRQVLYNRESTERQYALKEKAHQLGWALQNIEILDGDLGQSGKDVENRDDFKTLLVDVSMNKVGAIFVLETSRLSRSSAEWHRLLELCALTETLLTDEEGCYNLSDFNDQLVLGLKGTMSQAELHLIRSRLQGGKLNKAKKGQLRFPLPVGFCFDEEDQITLDPDEQVRETIQLLFDTFHQTRSAYGVVQHFAKSDVLFPKRAYGGVWSGKLIFGRLTHSRVLEVLKNPSYAGTSVYGRYESEKKLTSTGKIRVTPKRKPIDEWLVTIHEHHTGYIIWEEYLENQRILQNNLTHGEGITLTGPLREGLALLQGLLICGVCGRRLSIRYQGNGGIYPTYQCNGKKREGLSGNSCMTLKAPLLDEAIVQRIFKILQPEQIQLAVEALEMLQQREQKIDKQWQLKLQRARYEMQLAQRRYESVDPENRLVAATLENRWNEALLHLEALQQQYENYQSQTPLQLNAKQKQSLLELAKDLPNLWSASTTKAQDKKQILRLLIEDITVERTPKSKTAILHIRWKGGACEDLSVPLPPRIQDQLRYPQETVEQVRGLAKTLLDQQIAETFNQKGLLSSKGKPFTTSMIQWIRYKHKILPPQLKETDELTVKELAQHFQISPHVVYYRIERGYLKARRIKKGFPYWIRLDPQLEEELRQRIILSSKIPKTPLNSSCS